jgi:hypothetical protein
MEKSTAEAEENLRTLGTALARMPVGDLHTVLEALALGLKVAKKGGSAEHPHYPHLKNEVCVRATALVIAVKHLSDLSTTEHPDCLSPI